MNNKKAITILNHLREKLKDKKNHHIRWNVQTISYIERFFKDHKNRVSLIEYADWNKFSHEDLVETLTNLINDCIEDVNNYGIYKEPKTNWLNQIPNGWVIAIVSGLCVLSVGFGRYFSNVNERALILENQRLKKEYNSFLKLNSKPESVPDSLELK